MISLILPLTLAYIVIGCYLRGRLTKLGYISKQWDASYVFMIYCWPIVTIGLMFSALARAFEK